MIRIANILECGREMETHGNPIEGSMIDVQTWRTERSLGGRERFVLYFPSDWQKVSLSTAWGSRIASSAARDAIWTTWGTKWTQWLPKMLASERCSFAKNSSHPEGQEHDWTQMVLLVSVLFLCWGCRIRAWSLLAQGSLQLHSQPVLFLWKGWAHKAAIFLGRLPEVSFLMKAIVTFCFLASILSASTTSDTRSADTWSHRDPHGICFGHLLT